MGIEFSEEKNFNEVYQNTTTKKVGGITKWLIDKKIVKDEKGANTILLIISFICIALSIYFLYK